MQDEGAAPEVVLTAVPAGLVKPDNEGAAALAAGAAYPALQPADASAAAEVVRASLQAAVAASPRAAAAGADLWPARVAAVPKAHSVLTRPLVLILFCPLVCCGWLHKGCLTCVLRSPGACTAPCSSFLQHITRRLAG